MKSRGIHRFGLVLSFSSTEAFYGMARIDSGVQLRAQAVLDFVIILLLFVLTKVQRPPFLGRKGEFPNELLTEN